MKKIQDMTSFAITERATVRYDYKCKFCKKTFTFDTRQEAELFMETHEPKCEYNIEAKRCRTCGRCYMPNRYSLTCEIGKDELAMSPCQFYEPTRPHAERQVPVLKRDITVPQIEYTVKKGTTMEYFYGQYVIQKIPLDARKHIGVYVDKLMEWRVNNEDIVWLPESQARDLHQKQNKE